MRIIASTRPGRPHLTDVAMIRLNGAYLMSFDYETISEEYSDLPLFIDIPTKRDKVKVSDMHIGELAALLNMRKEKNYIAVSKVESPKDLDFKTNSLICSKIESLYGVVNVEDIMIVSDMLCIDRVDLIREIGFLNYLRAEDLIINTAKRAGKPIAIASDILPSIVTNKEPTIPQTIQLKYYHSLGVDYIILAEETAVGFYPYHAIDIVNSINRIMG
jgi:pyruvate kinase